MSHVSPASPPQPREEPPPAGAEQRRRFGLRIWHKLGAVAVAFLVPLILGTVYLINQRNASIDTANRELSGIDILRPLSSVTLDLFEYRSLALEASRSGTGVQQQVTRLETAIDGDFARLSGAAPSVQQRLNATLSSEGQVQLEVSALTSEWAGIKAAGPTDALSADFTPQLVSNVLALYSYLGDVSGLHLDPQLDTFYTGTAMLTLEPVLQDQISQFGDATAAPASTGGTSSVVQTAGLLNEQLGQLNDALNRAFDATPADNNDTALRPTLSPLLEQASASVSVLVGAANSPGSAGAGSSLTPATARTLAGSARKANTQLWNALFDQEDRMLHTRIAKNQTQNTVVLGVIAASLAAIVILTTLTSRRIARNISHVADAAGNLAEGDLGQRAQVTSHDEIAMLAGTFNSMADHLQESHAALQKSHDALQESYTAVEEKVRQRTRSLRLLQGVASAAAVTTWKQALAEGLPLICDHMGWEAALAYTADVPGEEGPTSQPSGLHGGPTWYTRTEWLEPPSEALANRPASPLVTRAHASGRPQGPEPLGAGTPWATALPARVGVIGAVAFPVLIPQGTAGVVEFLTHSLQDLGEADTALVAGLLSQLGQVREREITAQALKAAAEAAEAASRAKSAFLATMSHEIRTPMNAVMGMGELMLDTPLNQEQLDYARTIHDSAESLLTIINDILDFSKVEAGKFDLEHIPVDLHACVESAFDLIAPKAHEKTDLELAYLIDPALPAWITGDPVRLRQIVINLLGNAVKFTDTGEIVLTATVNTPEAPHQDQDQPRGASADALTVHFAVRDTGVGIPADRIPQLFRAFEQLDSSTTRRYGGTGLGLAISSRLVHLMGGRIWAESTPGRGSTFHFTITTTPAPSLPPVAETGAALRGKRLLAVDDNPTNRMILSRHADAWGMHTRTTGSAGQAMAWIRDGDPFDIAVLDMQMPHMDGITLAREITRLRPDLPMILLTSSGRPESPPQELSIFSACHTKPIKAAQLYESLRHALDNPLGTPPELPATAAPIPVPQTRPLRILLAEDNQVNQRLALRMLSKIGYTADAVGDGEQALQALRRQPYDVVLMDVHMPVMNGLDASRAIHREWPQAQRPHIIALTASAMREDQDACLAAGMDDYLTKPLSLTTLADTLAPLTPRPDAGPPQSLE